MSHQPPTDRLLTQGRALVRAIEALATIEPSGPIVRFLAGLLVAAYKRRLRAIVAEAPEWVVEEIAGASERVGERPGKAAEIYGLPTSRSARSDRITQSIDTI